MGIITHLAQEIELGSSLHDILRAQHNYHENRRWSVQELIGDRTPTDFDDADRAALWHATRAEVTTQPAGVRMAIDGVDLAERLARTNPKGAKVAHAAASWSARYWLEEEGHHEVAFSQLLEMTGVDPLSDEEVSEHRGLFPTDSLARVCVLQACVEEEASVHYRWAVDTSRDALIRQVFQHVLRDEAQHRAYLFSFAKGFVDTGVYPYKDIFSMAYMWVRPRGGETFGTAREAQTQRRGFVNWWERVRTDEQDAEDRLAFRAAEFRSRELREKKLRGVLAGVSMATDVRVSSLEELRRAYVASLATNDPDRIRSAVHGGAGNESRTAVEPSGLHPR